MAGSTEWRTPPAFFRKLQEEFHFTVDAAANNENALVRPHLKNCPHGEVVAAVEVEAWDCGRYCGWCGWVIGRYFTAEDDALAQDWGSERVYCNPPYSPGARLYRFVEKASASAKAGALVVMLLNATTTDTRWFHRFIWDANLHRGREGVEVRFLQGRIAFHGVLNTPIPSPRYSNMVVVFHPWAP
jgi:hypothetical protein